MSAAKNGSKLPVGEIKCAAVGTMKSGISLVGMRAKNCVHNTHLFTENTEIQTMRMMTTTPETPPPMNAPVLSPFLLPCFPPASDSSDAPKQVE